MLPLKSDLVASNMAKKFDDVQPSLLLFLHRLRSITVEDRVSREVGRGGVRRGEERGGRWVGGGRGKGEGGWGKGRGDAWGRGEGGGGRGEEDRFGRRGVEGWWRGEESSACL